MIEVLNSLGYSTEFKTKSTIVLKTEIQRHVVRDLLLTTIPDSYYDAAATGSSFGAVICGKYKILIKGKRSPLDAEEAAISTMRNCFRISEKEIPIYCNGMKYFVSGVEKVEGTPKADFALVNDSGERQIFVSHKKGFSPKCFQQWGGITEERISANEHVLDFTADVKNIIGESIQRGFSLAKKIPLNSSGIDLRLMSVFGLNFDDNQYSANKCNIILQGDPSLIGFKDGFKLHANHVHEFGDLPKNEFDPSLAIMYKGDRNNLGIAGARASISPIGGRKFTSYI